MKMKEFDKYLVPEQLEQKKYRFGNGYGALVTYYRPTNTYDLHPIKWIGEQNIFIDEPCINTTSKKEYVEVEKDEEIVYDVRKEEQMSEKYVVSQEFMDELEEWKINLKSYDDINNYFVGTGDLRNLPILANLWASDRHITNKEHNNRLIAIIRWVNGEDVFEAEKPKKWVVQSKDSSESGVYVYLRRIRAFGIITTEGVIRDYATKFDTKKEAESWANAHQEVIEVDE